MRKIEPYSLWVGNVGDVWDLRRVHEEGIAALVDLAVNEPPAKVTRELVYCRFPLVDGLGNATWLLRTAIETTAALVARRVPTLVYCSAGLSRSRLIAAAAHVVLSPGSPVPTVGASGAISGVLGAYLLLYPHVRVRMLFWFLLFIRVIAVPAWAVLLWWFFWQVIAGLPQLMTLDREVSGGVAVWAHIGGFVAGMVLVKLFVNEDLHRRRLAMTDARDVFA